MCVIESITAHDLIINPYEMVKYNAITRLKLRVEGIGLVKTSTPITGKENNNFALAA